MKTATKDFSKYVSVPSDKGVRVDKSITINRPVADVYSFWRRLNNLPRFMRHLESVTVRDDLHSHWAVRTFGGKILEWDSEIIEQRENEMISWRSIPGADVDNAGSVWFNRLPGEAQTALRVELKYLPRAGKAGAMMAKLLGADVEAKIGEDLARLKCLLETGTLPAAEPAVGRRGRIMDVTGRTAWAADDFVRENPWMTIGCIAAGFFALGFLLGGRQHGQRISVVTWKMRGPARRFLPVQSRIR